MNTKTLPEKKKSMPLMISKELLVDLCHMIDQAQRNVAATVNMSLTMLNWRIGKRIKEEVLQGARGEYGRQIVVTLSRQLIQDYGKSFNEKNIRRMGSDILTFGS